MSEFAEMREPVPDLETELKLFRAENVKLKEENIRLRVEIKIIKEELSSAQDLIQKLEKKYGPKKVNQESKKKESVASKEDDRNGDIHFTQIKNKQDLDRKLGLAGNNLVVVDFYAHWCGPCKQISPRLEELVKEYKGVHIFKVDVDECEDIAMDYEVSSMPTFVLMKKKEVITQMSGSNYEKLKNLVCEHK